jgi:hypothetical protein
MLSEDFSRVSAPSPTQICKEAGVRADAEPRRLSSGQVESVFRAIPDQDHGAADLSASPHRRGPAREGLQTRVRATSRRR